MKTRSDTIPGNKKDPCTCSHLLGDHYFNMDDNVVCGKCAYPNYKNPDEARRGHLYYLHPFTLDNLKYVEKIQKEKKRIR